MNNDTFELPNDVQFNMSLIHQEWLSQQYDLIRSLVASHETELMLLWGCVVGLTLVIIWDEHNINKLSKELNGR